MMIFSCISVVAAWIMGIIISITDIKKNIISNKVLVLFGLFAVFIDLLQVALNVQVLWSIYFLNLIVTTALAIILYVVKVWAAGDSKALIVLAALLPASFGMMKEKLILCGILIVAISFVFSFVYLIAESIWLLIVKKKPISKKGIKEKIKQFIISFGRNVIYLSLVLKVERYHAGGWFSKHIFAMIGVNICIILIISSVSVFKKKYLISLCLFASIMLSVLLNEWFLDEARLKYYVLLVGIMLVRAVVSEYNYEIIPTEKIEKGMILSTFTTMMMTESKVRGLPEISREDMRSRLTEEEAQAVIRWGKSKKGMKEIQIVRKTPYAIFICLGLIVYSIYWGLTTWY